MFDGMHAAFFMIDEMKLIIKYVKKKILDSLRTTSRIFPSEVKFKTVVVFPYLIIQSQL